MVLISEAQTHLDDWRFSGITRSEFVRRWREKTYVFCDADHPVCFLPGLYPSVPKAWQDPSKQLGFPYVGLSRFGEDLPAEPPERDLLFSFSGQLQNHPCRRRLGLLINRRSQIVDTSGTYYFALPAEKRQEIRERYRLQLVRSKFVLCARGVGASSYRLYEALAAGCVPVVISDQWVEPPGIPWRSFSIRVGETEVARIPELLAEREPDFAAMQAQGKAVFHQFLGEPALFNYLGDCLERLADNRPRKSPGATLRRWRGYTSVAALRRVALSKVAARGALRVLRKASKK